jgi:Serine phosphatase RsbU, regulator of sigma subunit
MVGLEGPHPTTRTVSGDREPAPAVRPAPPPAPRSAPCPAPRPAPEQASRRTPGTPTELMRDLRAEVGGPYATAPLAMTPPPGGPYQTHLAHVQVLGDMGWCTWNLCTGEASWSEHMYVIFDRAPEEGPIGLCELRDHVEPADAAAFDRALHGVLGGSRSQAEFRIRTRRGVQVLRTVLDPVTAPGGGIGTVYGVIQDITRAAEERSITDALSHAILPRQGSVIDLPGARVAVRYLPSESTAGLGGDWYQACRASRDRVLIAIGDVSGHGRDVIAPMARLRHALDGLGVTDAPPDQLLAWLNELVWHSHDGTTATALAGYLDPVAEEFTWAQAGHLPPILVSRGTARVLDAPDGVLLGADGRSCYGLGRVRLRRGDTLLLYTDGVVERPGRDIDDGLALTRLAATAVTGDDLPADLDRVITAVGGTNPADDACLLAVRLPLCLG